MSSELILSTLLSPIVLFFVLGLGAALLRSEMTVPEAFAKGLAIYLMMAIGLKGGVEMSKTALTPEIFAIAGVALLLSMEVPAIMSALILAKRGMKKSGEVAGSEKGELFRHAVPRCALSFLIRYGSECRARITSWLASA